MKKTRSDAKLLNLPEGQQAQLAEWLLSGVPYHRAREMVKAEFGLDVSSLSAFSAFWEEVCGPLLLTKRTRAVRTAGEVAEAVSRSPGMFDAATVDQLKQRAFEMAISPQSDPDQVKAIFTLVLKAQTNALKGEELALAKEKFQFDAAAACLKKLPELKAIAGDNQLDQDQKLRAIREKLFGELPRELTANGR